MQAKVSVVICEGGSPGSEVERLLVKVRHAVLLDNLEKMKQVAAFGSFYLLTNYPGLAAEAQSLGVKIYLNELTEEQFHFGAELAALINLEQLENVFYMGGAGIPLVTVPELQEICTLLLGAREIIYANNVMSADVIAFKPGRLINEIVLPAMDNVLGMSLRDEAGVEQRLFRNTAGLLFDLDTPADLLILAGSPAAGPRTRRVLDAMNLDLSRLERAKKVLAGDYEEAILLGRVGAPVIAHINQNLKLRLRVFSEERGMKALGREEKGEVVSLMGFFLEEVGPQRFMRYLEKVAQCAFLDTRVLMSHLLGHRPTAEDRFFSDLGYWQEIKNPVIREFTKAAVEAAIPILCGAHSLILGGLWALVDEIGPTHHHYRP
ncbi:MAG: hypothetical protein GX334_01920 [Firmicutes bacterium]|nr:hypothetical protein [Bacillota bacterium]